MIGTIPSKIIRIGFQLTRDPTTDPTFFQRRLNTSWSISILWIFLSTSLAILSTFSFLQMEWIVKRELVVTTNLNKSRISINQSTDSTYNPNPLKAISSSVITTYPLPVFEFKNETIFYDIASKRSWVKITKVIRTLKFGLIGACESSNDGKPHCFLYENQESDSISSIWPILTLIGGSGCITLCASAALSILVLILPSAEMRFQIAKTIGHAQTVAVVLMITSVMGFPLGFSSEFVRRHCGPFVTIFSPGDCEIGWAYALVLVSTSLSLYCPVLTKFTAEIRWKILTMDTM